MGTEKSGTSWALKLKRKQTDSFCLQILFCIFFMIMILNLKSILKSVLCTSSLQSQLRSPPVPPLGIVPEVKKRTKFQYKILFICLKRHNNLHMIIGKLEDFNRCFVAKNSKLHRRTLTVHYLKCINALTWQKVLYCCKLWFQLLCSLKIKSSQF